MIDRDFDNATTRPLDMRFLDAPPSHNWAIERQGLLIFLLILIFATVMLQNLMRG